jgi:hypothetical protein
MRRRTEITLEIDRIVLVNPNQTNSQWCARCDEYVPMLTIAEAAIAARVNWRTIFGWADSGRLHSTETSLGLLLIFPNSIFGVHLPC